MPALNWADYTIIGLISFSTLISLARGFVREAISLVTWAAAFWIAFTFYDTLSQILETRIHSSSIRMAVAFGGLFLVTLIIGALVNFLIGKLVDRTGMSGTDRLLGLVFGMGRGVLLVAVLLLLARLSPMPGEAWWQQSVMIPYYQPVEIWMSNYLPQSVSEQINFSDKGLDLPKPKPPTSADPYSAQKPESTMANVIPAPKPAQAPKATANAAPAVAPAPVQNSTAELNAAPAQVDPKPQQPQEKTIIDTSKHASNAEPMDKNPDEQQQDESGNQNSPQEQNQGQDQNQDPYQDGY